MIPFTLSKDISFELPQDYGELTIKQFLLIKNNPGGDFIDLLSILSGLSREVWEQCKDFNIDVKIAPFIEWVNEPFNPDGYTLPDNLIINGKEIDRPKDIRYQTYGQKLALQKEFLEVQKKGGNDVDIIPFALALYFQPAYYDCKHDMDKVDELLPLVMECKIQLAYPIGYFFLNSYARLLVSKERSFLMFLQKKKYEQVLIDSHNLKSSAQSTLYQKASASLTMMFYKSIIILFSLLFGMRRNSQLIKGN
jgi:hypothetical protein